MDAKEILDGYMAEFHTEPVLKTWECPDFYRTSYHYTEKKIAKIAEKENARLRAEYEKQLGLDKAFKRYMNKILDCPAPLALFFAESTKGFIEQTRNRRKELKERMDVLHESFAREFVFTYKSPSESEPYTVNYKVSDKKQDFLWHCTKKVNGAIVLGERKPNHSWAMFDAAFPSDEAKADFISKAIEYDKLKLILLNMEYPSEVFYRMVEHIGGDGGIIDSMVRVLGGMPDRVEFDSNWGVGGYYNGIVSREDKRASFKSFYAGGWNIQRLHIRFRVTLLKSNAV